MPDEGRLGATPAELLRMCQARGGHVNALVPFAGNVIPVENAHTHLLNAASWSRTTVLRVTNARQVPIALVEGLGALPDPTIEQICQHAAFICAQSAETMRAWQADRRDMWLEGRSDRTGRSGTFRQQLEMACYVLLATAEPASLQACLQDAPIVLLYSAYAQTFEFVKPSHIFVDLNYSAAPYAYTLRDVETNFGRMRLHTLLDCPRTPTLEQVHGWLEDLSTRSRGGVLTEAQLRSAGVLADLAGFKMIYSAASLNMPNRPFLLPDRAARMQPATHLLVDDAPWLEGRVDKSENGHLPVVHSLIQQTTALRLGARGLSNAVVELPDGAMEPLPAAQIDGQLGGGLSSDVSKQIAVWNENIRSRAFRVSVRRAVQFGRRASSLLQSTLTSQQNVGEAADLQSRVDELRHASIVVVAEIRSRFIVKQDDGTEIDVTARSGRYGSDALTVLSPGSSGPCIFLKLSTGGSADGEADGSGPPALGRQRSGYRALQKIFKRWKPCLATELDRFLGEGAVRDRMLLVELLDVDHVSEMPDMMNRYKIPMGSFEAWIGTRYDEARDGKPRQLLEGRTDLTAHVREKVLFPADRLPDALQEDGDARRGVLLLGRLDRIVRGQCVVAVTGDDETCVIDPTALLRPPTREEEIADKRAAAEAAEAARGESTAAAAAAAFAANASRAQAPTPATPAAASAPTPEPPPPGRDTPASPYAPPIAAKCKLHQDFAAAVFADRGRSYPAVSEFMEALSEETVESSGTDFGTFFTWVDTVQTALREGTVTVSRLFEIWGLPLPGRGEPTAEASSAAPPPEPPVPSPPPDEADENVAPEVNRVEYKPAAGWLESELLARRALAERLEARRAEAPPQREAEGMDSVLNRSEAVQMQDVPGSHEKVPVSKTSTEGMHVTAAVKHTPGYDLVRVGNFTEKVGVPADIAFFHNYPTLAEIYDERRFGRQRLVREVCGALRDLCDHVFYPFDAAKVTLFYEPGAGSRFVRQKLLFNIWPIEQRKADKKLHDVRTDSFVYAYLYGLLVHKLAHFFDVVHV